MVSPKRTSSLPSPVDRRAAKRRRPNTPPKQSSLEVIEISSDDESKNLNPLNAKDKGKEKRKAPELSDSEIEILSTPPPSVPDRVAARKVKKKFGKGKAKAKPVTYDVDDFFVAEEGPSSTSKSKNTYEIGTSQSDDSFDRQELVDRDEALAQKLAQEWAAADRDMELEEPKNVAESSFAGSSRDAVNLPQSNSNPESSKKPRKVLLDIPSIKLPVPEPSSLAELKTLLSRAGQCSQCQKVLRLPRGQVIFEYPPGQEEGFPPSLGALVHATCPSKSCNEHYCRGCLTPVNCRAKCPGPVPGSTCEVLNCCAEGRALALFEVLAAFDQQYLAEKATSETRAQANLKISRGSGSGVGTVGPGGTGYGTGAYPPQGYMGGRGRGRGRSRGRGAAQMASSSHMDIADPIPPIVPSSASIYAAHWDQTVARALATIRDLLPSPCSDCPAIYDLLPHPSLASLILMSYIPTILAQLLRNDSVTDWISRKQVYHAMLSLLRRMADSEIAIQVLTGRRPEVSQSPGLGACLKEGGEIAWQRNDDGSIELAPPLLEHFKKLTKQSETFLHSASQQLAEGDEEDGFIDGLALCGDIIAGRDDIARAMTVMGTAAHSLDDMKVDDTSAYTPSNGKPSGSGSKGKGRGRARKPINNRDAFDIEKEYISACEQLGFEHKSLAEEGPGGLVYGNYNYASSLTATQNSTRMPKDRLHLAKELAVMATSLPPGIWVRVDDVRNDAIKVMIAGPQGTPYAGGLFEFDVFMPLTYPNSPPLVHLRTTGRGSVRFNPNLYNEGKVCLSLLGTWPGSPEEQWTPKSTLLQVLVSIQSMILIDAPYYNEPGHGKANLNSPASKTYNRNIQVQTVRWAMVGWLQDEHRHGLWADVIKSHFSILEDKIRKQMLEWANDNPAMRNYTNPYGYGSSAMHSVAFYDENMPPVMTAGSMNGSGQIPNMILPPVPGGRFGRHPPTAPTHKPLDLIEEFDLGMRRLESWTAEED